MASLIAEATKDCLRDDCSLSLGAGTVTCMGWSPTYDKQGRRTDRGDPNIHTQSLRCFSCGRKWVAQTQYENTTLTETKE